MSQSNLAGQEILGYQVTEKIGSGAFGTVYKAKKRNPTGEYTRALKHITLPTIKQYAQVLNAMGSDVEKTNEYFTQMLNNIISEVRILNDLSEKNVNNVVRYYENDVKVFENPKRYDIFILMEYLNPLDKYIYTHNFTVSDVIDLGLDILTGLEACHNNNIIHRDVKIDNIFVTDNGTFKIGDFGVSKVLNDSTRAESIKGTPEYLAPEVYLGKESYTRNVDLYSLGVVLYKLLNHNRNAFLPSFPKAYTQEDESIAFEKRIRGEKPTKPLMGGEAIGDVLIKALSSKEDRFKTSKELYDALVLARENTPQELLDERIEIEYFPENTDELINSLNSFDETVKLGTGTDDFTGSVGTEIINDRNKGIFDTVSLKDDQNINVHHRENVSNQQQIYTNYQEPPKGQVSKTGWIFISIIMIVLLAIMGYLIYQIFNIDSTTIANSFYTADIKTIFNGNIPQILLKI